MCLLACCHLTTHTSVCLRRRPVLKHPSNAALPDVQPWPPLPAGVEPSSCCPLVLAGSRHPPQAGTALQHGRQRHIHLLGWAVSALLRPCPPSAGVEFRVTEEFDEDLPFAAKGAVQGPPAESGTAEAVGRATKEASDPLRAASTPGRGIGSSASGSGGTSDFTGLLCCDLCSVTVVAVLVCSR